MKLKMSEDGKSALVQDGKPIYVHDDGKEIPFDAVATVQTLNRTLEESKKYKDRAQTAETALKGFEGIEDAEAARKAIDTLKNIDEGKLLTAGKVQEIKDAAKKAAEDQVAAANKASAESLTKANAESAKLADQLHKTMIGGGFARSKLITDDKHPVSLTLRADAAEKIFGNHYKVEDGKVIGYDKSGNKIFSRTRPGEIADFDEALETIVEQYPDRDYIVRGANHSGPGSRPGAIVVNGKRTITRAEFEKLDPMAQGKAAYGKDAMTIVD